MYISLAQHGNTFLFYDDVSLQEVDWSLKPFFIHSLCLPATDSDVSSSLYISTVLYQLVGADFSFLRILLLSCQPCEAVRVGQLYLRWAFWCKISFILGGLSGDYLAWKWHCCVWCRCMDVSEWESVLSATWWWWVSPPGGDGCRPSLSVVLFMCACYQPQCNVLWRLVLFSVSVWSASDNISMVYHVKW